MKKKFWFLVLLFFVSDVISKVCFSHFGLLVFDLGPTARQKHFAEVFNEISVESASYEILIDFLVFLVQRL